MEIKVSATLYCGAGLSKTELLDLTVRQERLRLGKELLSTISDVEIQNEFQSSCTLVLFGQRETLQRIKETVQQQGIGSLKIEQEVAPPVRAGFRKRFLEAEGENPELN